MNEADFIAAMRKLPLHPGARGLQDDCALLEIGSETLILTHDAMAAGTHWLPDHDMADVAWKLVATNLSDLAAKGAEPIGVLLGHSLGNDDGRFVEGLDAVLSKYNVPLLGGDTISAKGPQTLGLTAIGRATHTPVPSRSGAQVGDGLYVIGKLGMAMLGMEELGTGSINDLAFRRPRPLLEEGRALAPHVSAMMDISDGLLLDAHRMASASDCSLRIASENVPVADETRRGECMRWGDDYQLLFTASTDINLPAHASLIGMVEARGESPLMLDGEWLTDVSQLGYQHG